MSVRKSEYSNLGYETVQSLKAIYKRMKADDKFKVVALEMSNKYLMGGSETQKSEEDFLKAINVTLESQCL